MTEKKTKKLRFQLLELFPNATGDVAARVGTVSRQIKFKKQHLHPMYGIAWYALVEELFIHNQSDQLQDMSDFLKTLDAFGQKLNPAQQVQINSAIQWLDDLVGACINLYSIEEKSFISIYSTLFYTRVFKEYAEDQAQLNSKNQQSFYLEDALSLVSSFIIMKEFSQRWQNNQLDPELKTKLQTYYLQLVGDVNFKQNEQYLAGIDQNRVNALSFFYNLSLRVYQEINGEIQTFTKVSISSLDKQNLGLGVIFCNDDSYCIAYDSTLEAQFSLLSHYKQRKQVMTENLQRIQVNIQGQKNENYQRQKQDRSKYQYELEQLKQLFNQNIEKAQVEEQKNIDLANKCTVLENEVEQKLREANQYHEELLKKQNVRNNQNQATLAYYSEQNNFMIQYKNDMVLKKLAAQNEQKFLEKKQKEYAEYLAKNKNTLEETNFNIAQGKYAQVSVPDNFKSVILNPIKKINCQNCCDDKIISEMIFMNCCGFQICAECMKQAFANNLKTLDSLKCLNEKCKKPFRDLVPFYQQGLLSDQDLKKLTEKFTYICPIDHTNFTLKESQSKTSKLGSYIVTPCCQTEICRHCWQIKHKKGEVCKSRVDSYLQNIRVIIQSINQKVLELEKNPQKLSEKDLKAQKEELLKQKRFRFCPDCEILLIKDEHCERLECPQCKLEVCFNCVAPNLPIKDHDNCYHRDGCKYFAAEMPNDPRKMNPKCVFCQKKGSVCDLPASWKQYQQLVRTWYGDAFFAEEFAFNWINN